MKVSIGIGGAASGRRRDFEEQTEFVVEADRLGVDAVWSAEAWGQDAVAPLAYLAAKTSRIRLGTGIMQVTARTPVMTAMTALTMAAITNDRFILGLGNSGPQVVEGLHGVPFHAPLARMKEAVEIIRLAFAGEKIEYHGKYHELPNFCPRTFGELSYQAVRTLKKLRRRPTLITAFWKQAGLF